MLKNGDVIEGYTLLAIANGVVLAHSVTAPDPFVVWYIDSDDNGVHTGSYQQSKEEAEIIFVSRAFPWFEKQYVDIDRKQIEDFRHCLDKAREAINLVEIEFETMMDSLID